jgi:hypothetical protein
MSDISTVICRLFGVRMVRVLGSPEMIYPFNSVPSSRTSTISESEDSSAVSYCWAAGTDEENPKNAIIIISHILYLCIGYSPGSESI